MRETGREREIYKGRDRGAREGDREIGKEVVRVKEVGWKQERGMEGDRNKAVRQ